MFFFHFENIGLIKYLNKVFTLLAFLDTKVLCLKFLYQNVLENKFGPLGFYFLCLNLELGIRRLNNKVTSKLFGLGTCSNVSALGR